MLKQFSIKKINLKINTFKRLKGRKKFEYLAEKVYFIVFKHKVCTLKEIIESEREKYKKKQSELRILPTLPSNLSLFSFNDKIPLDKIRLTN
jgi:histidyl-tRNA synthetase